MRRNSCGLRVYWVGDGFIPLLERLSAYADRASYILGVVFALIEAECGALSGELRVFVAETSRDGCDKEERA